MSDMDRRRFAECAAAFAAVLASGAPARAAQDAAAAPPPHDMSAMPAHWMGEEKIAFLIYPGFTALDMIGPHYMLANLMGATIEIVAKTKEPVRSDAGLVVTPTATFETASSPLDVVCIPGGSLGTLAAMRDDATLDFLRAAGRKARHVTSVCTGSLLLGSAGLLDGYRATSHWVTKPLLPIFGAVPADGRVVRDRNRITAEGVTAGLDFALALVAQLRDQTYAEGVQLLAQYAPEPPFAAGAPETAPPAVTKMIDGMFVGLRRDMREAGAAAFARSRGG
ncbi:DJ-1/PfpI family protein [Methylosinus sp. Sm6]|uniref:DJ-1/PfpI family protein n=1 Tax=Methylosinus sp. Sm6 TaxID=2866948 RepID=UPI001C99E964|nr:DJ-1/PfpI family protein [Methylosinus sp. Sm6]MBY6240621.1 DJ-1/PfpI family protein [Methylosinus sp. Sm6]